MITSKQLIMTTRAKLIASQEAACSPLYFFVCEVVVVSQTEAGANSAKTMKAIPTPRVTHG